MAYEDIPLGLRTQLEADTKVIRDDLKVKQDAHFTEHGRYWQGLATHDTPPNDGVPTRANYTKVADSNKKRRKDGKAENTEIGGSWDDVVTAAKASDLGVSLACHEYVGPRGAGWILESRVVQGGDTYMKLENFGPEIEREQDWTLVPDEGA